MFSLLLAGGVRDIQDTCGICMEEFTMVLRSGRALCTGDDSECVTTPCGHKFHKNCIIPWLSSARTCPTCRGELDDAWAARTGLPQQEEEEVMQEGEGSGVMSAEFSMRISGGTSLDGDFIVRFMAFDDGALNISAIPEGSEDVSPLGFILSYGRIAEGGWAIATYRPTGSFVYEVDSPFSGNDVLRAGFALLPPPFPTSMFAGDPELRSRSNTHLLGLVRRLMVDVQRTLRRERPEAANIRIDLSREPAWPAVPVKIGAVLYFAQWMPSSNSIKLTLAGPTVSDDAAQAIVLTHTDWAPDLPLPGGRWVSIMVPAEPGRVAMATNDQIGVLPSEINRDDIEASIATIGRVVGTFIGLEDSVVV